MLVDGSFVPISCVQQSGTEHIYPFPHSLSSVHAKQIGVKQHHLLISHSVKKHVNSFSRLGSPNSKRHSSSYAVKMPPESRNPASLEESTVSPNTTW